MIVCSADIEEVAVFVAPCGVAGVIYAAAPRFAGLLFVAVIAHEEAAGRALIGTDDDLARFADRRRRAVRQNEVDIVKRARDAHGAAFRYGADRVVNGKRGLRLAEALIDGKAGGALPLLVDLGVQGFACRGAVLDGGKVIFGEIFLNEEAVHSGRRAERGDVVLLEHR